MNPAVNTLDPKLRAVVQAILEPGKYFGDVEDRLCRLQDAQAGCTLCEEARTHQLITIIRALAK